jgi:hypothetical protein
MRRARSGSVLHRRGQRRECRGAARARSLSGGSDGDLRLWRHDRRGAHSRLRASPLRARPHAHPALRGNEKEHRGAAQGARRFASSSAGIRTSARLQWSRNDR